MPLVQPSELAPPVCGFRRPKLFPLTSRTRTRGTVDDPHWSPRFVAPEEANKNRAAALVYNLRRQKQVKTQAGNLLSFNSSSSRLHTVGKVNIDRNLTVVERNRLWSLRLDWGAGGLAGRAQKLWSIW